MARRAEDRERRHIRAEEREQKNELAQRAIGQKIIFRRMLAHFAAESEDADVNDDRQVSEDEKGRDQSVRASLSSPSKCDGHAYLTSAHINAEITSV